MRDLRGNSKIKINPPSASLRRTSPSSLCYAEMLSDCKMQNDIRLQ
jgi:hypothetical protein